MEIIHQGGQSVRYTSIANDHFPPGWQNVLIRLHAGLPIHIHSYLSMLTTGPLSRIGGNP